MKNIYTINGMHCQSCVKKVREALLPYVHHIDISLNPPRATLQDLRIDLAHANQVLAQIGQYQLEAIPVVPHASQTETEETNKSFIARYRPILLIAGYLFSVTLLIQLNHPSGFHLRDWMQHFMAGFFLIFSFFKLLDVSAFANSYAMYDVIAMRWRTYGLIYPFIELSLGLAYLNNWQAAFVNSFTLIVMGISTIGVVQSMRRKQTIRCACLGTVFNLPVAQVTLIENLSMFLMAGYMAYFSHF